MMASTSMLPMLIKVASLSSHTDITNSHCLWLVIMCDLKLIRSRSSTDVSGGSYGWRKMPSLVEPRGHACACVYQGSLYVIGTSFTILRSNLIRSIHCFERWAGPGPE